MPIDPTLLPALERELAMAKQIKPGGQRTAKGRIAAIEQAIAKCKAALEPAMETADAKPAVETRAAKVEPEASETE